MTKDEYTNNRKALLTDAESLMNEGKLEEANAKMEDVKKLDKSWEDIVKAQANLNALNGTQPKFPEPTNGDTTLKPVASIGKANEDSDEDYKHAWAKFAMGKTLDTKEYEVLDSVNQRFNADFTHMTTNTPTLIPNTVVEGIWKLAEEQYPLFADAQKFNVRGTLTFNKHDGIVAGDAQWVDEDAQADDEQNAFGQLVLKGFELNKVATISWKMKGMAEEDFVAFLQQELADRVGVAMGTAASQGDGATQAKGIVTELKAEEGTPQVVTYTDQVAYKDTTGAIAKIHSSFATSSVIYANNATIWNQLANIVDGNGKPIFITDTTAGGVGRMFGLVVKADAGLADGDILIGDASTYKINTNEAMTVAMEDHVKARKTDYGAYAIVDGGLITTKGFALLTAAPKA